MDKDVEVSRDQNTIIVQGVRMQAKPIDPYILSSCSECEVFRTVGNHDLCYSVPCFGIERKDLSSQIFVAIK